VVVFLDDGSGDAGTAAGAGDAAWKVLVLAMALARGQLVDQLQLSSYNAYVTACKMAGAAEHWQYMMRTELRVSQ
jgi:hypothetical protein